MPKSMYVSKDVSSLEQQMRQALLGVCRDYLRRSLPVRRLSPVLKLLAWSATWQNDEALFESLTTRIVEERQADGGWTDCEESAWHLLALRSLLARQQSHFALSETWLYQERVQQGWGYSRRDHPNIPITSLVRMALEVPDDDPSSTWLQLTWENDMHAMFQLSYKAAWYLLARADTPADSKLAHATVRHLLADQRDDGGWGPWRVHPAATDCFATGIALLALGMEPLANTSAVERCVMRGLGWIAANILDTGLFPTHYIEFGSAWLLAALSLCSTRWGITSLSH